MRLLRFCNMSTIRLAPASEQKLYSAEWAAGCPDRVTQESILPELRRCAELTRAAWEQQKTDRVARRAAARVHRGDLALLRDTAVATANDKTGAAEFLEATASLATELSAAAGVSVS